MSKGHAVLTIFHQPNYKIQFRLLVNLVVVDLQCLVSDSQSRQYATSCIDGKLLQFRGEPRIESPPRTEASTEPEYEPPKSIVHRQSRHF